MTCILQASDRQMGKSEEAAPQPPQAILFATSCAQEQGAEAGPILSKKGYNLLSFKNNRGSRCSLCFKV